jgi:hypothetical protein
LIDCEKERVTMTVVRNCTRTYLPFDSKDYKVCDSEKVSSFSNEARVEVIFKKINDCTGPPNDPPAC